MIFVEIFFTTLIATTLSAMSGGGSSLMNIPIFLSLGISFPLATFIQKLSSAFWVLPSAYNYLKSKKLEWNFVIWWWLLGTIGVYLGVIFVIETNQRILELLVGIIILFLVIYVTFKKDLGLMEKKVSKRMKILSYIFAPFLGFYESFFGSANGIAFAIVNIKTRGFDFKDSLGYYFLVAFPWEIVAVAIFIQKGIFDIGLAIPSILGSFVGGYIGSKYASSKGNKFIKICFVTIGSVLGLKLLLGL